MPTFLAVFAFILLGALSQPAHAAGKYFYSFVGTDSNQPDMFSTPMNTMNVILSGTGWTSQVTADKDFNAKNFARRLQEIERSSQPGDQVLIAIDTHGMPTPDGKGHLIACGNKSCSTGQLEKVIAALQRKKVQVSLIDFSCFSGASQKLALGNTCVISAATSDDVAWNTFATSFVVNMNPGKSLEEVFLNARKASVSRGLPQISTTAGLYADSFVREIAEHPTMNVTIEDLASQNCASWDPRQLLSSLQNISGLSTKLDAVVYSTAITEYLQIYRQAQDLAKEITRVGNANHVSENGATFSWSTLILLEDNWLKTHVPDLYKIKMKLKSDPEFTRFQKLNKDFDTLTKVTGQSSPLADAALKVQNAEKPLYDKIYQSFSSTQRQGNPCAAFTL